MAGLVTVFLPRAFPDGFKQSVRRAGAEVVQTDEARAVCPGASTTGVLGVGVKEQGLCLDTEEGIVVITGCAHPGVVQMTRAARDASRKQVHAVLGGFHMGGASARQSSDVIEELKDLGVRRAGPCHCSGERARERMREAFGDSYINLGVGSRAEFARGKVKDQ